MMDVIENPVPRSVLFVPANCLDLAAKVATSGADAVCFDLEDAIPMEGKAPARQILAEAVIKTRQSIMNIYVRVNAELELFSDDLNAALNAGTDGIVLPKARGLEHICLVGEASCWAISLSLSPSATRSATSRSREEKMTETASLRQHHQATQQE